MERLRARIKAFERELHILGMILVIGAVLGVGGWLAGSGEAGSCTGAGADGDRSCTVQRRQR